MALKDKLMTLEDFKAVRDVDVASNSAQFTEIKADLGASVSFRAQEKPMYNQAVARENIGAERSLGVEYDDDDNLFDASTITENKAIWPSDGLAHTQNGYFASDYIDIHEYDKIILSGFGVPAVYDSSKTHMPNVGPETSNVVPVEYTVPDGVYYLRVTAKMDYIGVCSVIDSEGGKFKIPKLLIEKSQVLGGADETVERIADAVGLVKPSTLSGHIVTNYAYTGSGNISGYSGINSTLKLMIDSTREISCGVAFNTYALFDANGDFIRRVSPVPEKNSVSISDADAVYISLSFNMSKHTAEEVAAATISGVYVTTEKPIITVGTGKMFAGVLAAFKYAEATGKHCDIRIYAGTYDLYTEAGGETFISGISPTAEWSSGIQTIFNNGVSITGIGNVIIEYEVPDSVYSSYQHQCTRLSPINTRGGIEVSNLTFKLKNIRYAIHDECGNNQQYANSKHIVKNCYVYATNCNSCVGIGASASSYVFENCVFLNTGSAMYLHNWQDTNNGELIIKNCIVGNTGSGLRLDVLGNDVFNVAVLASHLAGARIYGGDSSYTTNCYRFVGINTNIDTITIDGSITSNVYEPILL